MNNALLLVYLGGVSDALCVVACVLIGLCITGVVACSILATMYDCGKTIEEDDKVKAWASRKIMPCMILGVIASIILVVLPSSKFCYLAAAASAAEYVIAETNVGKTLNSNVIMMIDDIGKVIHNLAENSCRNTK